MPNDDLGFLIALCIGLVLIGLLTAVAGIGMIMRQAAQNMRESTTRTQEIAEMHREVAFMVRRQYGDIDRDLQEIKE